MLLFASALYAGSNAQDTLDQAKTAFLAIDMGNFVALLLMFPLLMRPQSWQGLARNLVERLWDIIPIIIVFVLLAVIKIFPDSFLKSLVDSAGRESQNARSLLLLYLAWVYVFVTLPSLRQISAALGEAVLILIFRLTVAGALIATGTYLFQSAPLDVVRHPEFLAFTVLLIAPVSSFAPFIVKQAGAPQETEERIAHLVLASTMLFMVIGVAGVVVIASGAL